MLRQSILTTADHRQYDRLKISAAKNNNQYWVHRVHDKIKKTFAHMEVRWVSLTYIVVPGLCKLCRGGVASQTWRHDLITVIRARLDRNQATTVGTVEHLCDRSFTLTLHTNLHHRHWDIHIQTYSRETAFTFTRERVQFSLCWYQLIRRESRFYFSSFAMFLLPSVAKEEYMRSV